MIPKDPVAVLVPGRLQRDIKEKAILREKNRQYVIKELSNPFRHAYSGGTGHLEDKALLLVDAQNSMAADRKFIKFTHHFIKKFTLHMIPLALFIYLAKTSRDAFDHKCRTGQIAYADRNWKFI